MECISVEESLRPIRIVEVQCWIEYIFCESLTNFVFHFIVEYLDLHDNNLTGRMPKEICDMKLETLIADCHGPMPEVKCDCCTVCCEGLPVLACFDPKTGQQVSRAL